MTSFEESVLPLKGLVDKTEKNIKRIEVFDGEYPAPLLNEWRCAMRHVVAGEVDLARGHLQRAYFDSCDLLISCQLDAVRRTDDETRGYAKQVRDCVPNYTQLRQSVFEAQRWFHKAKTAGNEDKRQEAYQEMAVCCDALDAYLIALQQYRPDWKEEIRMAMEQERKQTRRDFRQLVAVAIASLSLLLGLLTFLLNFVLCGKTR